MFSAAVCNCSCWDNESATKAFDGLNHNKGTKLAEHTKGTENRSKYSWKDCECNLEHPQHSSYTMNSYDSDIATDACCEHRTSQSKRKDFLHSVPWNSLVEEQAGLTGKNIFHWNSTHLRIWNAKPMHWSLIKLIFRGLPSYTSVNSVMPASSFTKVFNNRNKLIQTCFLRNWITRSICLHKAQQSEKMKSISTTSGVFGTISKIILFL